MYYNFTLCGSVLRGTDFSGDLDMLVRHRRQRRRAPSGTRVRPRERGRRRLRGIGCVLSNRRHLTQELEHEVLPSAHPKNDSHFKDETDGPLLCQTIQVAQELVKHHAGKSQQRDRQR